MGRSVDTRQAYGRARNVCNRACESLATPALGAYPAARCHSSPSSFPARARSPSGMGRALAATLAGRRRRLRRRRPRPRRADQRARLGRPGRAARPDRERPAGARSPTSIAILAALRERWAAAGLRAPRPGLRGRPLDGPVLGPRRGRGHLARRRRPARARARPTDAGVRARVATARWPRSSGSTTRGSPSWSPRPRRTASFVVANRNAPGQVVVSGERAAIEAGAELARALGAKRAIVLPVSVAAHSPLMAEAADGDARGPRRRRPSTIREPPLLANADAPSDRRPPRPAAPSSSST